MPARRLAVVLASALAVAGTLIASPAPAGAALKQRWVQSVPGGWFAWSSPAIGDVNGDGSNDVVVGGQNGKVYAWDANGTLLPGWPGTAIAAVASSPAIGDLDGDGRNEVAVGAGSLEVPNQQGGLTIFNRDGTSPVQLQAAPVARPAVHRRVQRPGHRRRRRGRAQRRRLRRLQPGHLRHRRRLRGEGPLQQHRHGVVGTGPLRHRPRRRPGDLHRRRRHRFAGRPAPLRRVLPLAGPAGRPADPALGPPRQRDVPERRRHRRHRRRRPPRGRDRHRRRLLPPHRPDARPAAWSPARCGPSISTTAPTSPAGRSWPATRPSWPHRPWATSTATARPTSSSAAPTTSRTRCGAPSTPSSATAAPPIATTRDEIVASPVIADVNGRAPSEVIVARPARSRSSTAPCPWSRRNLAINNYGLAHKNAAAVGELGPGRWAIVSAGFEPGRREQGLRLRLRHSGPDGHALAAVPQERPAPGGRPVQPQPLLRRVLAGRLRRRHLQLRRRRLLRLHRAPSA